MRACCCRHKAQPKSLWRTFRDALSAEGVSSARLGHSRHVSSSIALLDMSSVQGQLQAGAYERAFHRRLLSGWFIVTTPYSGLIPQEMIGEHRLRPMYPVLGGASMLSLGPIPRNTKRRRRGFQLAGASCKPSVHGKQDTEKATYLECFLEFGMLRDFRPPQKLTENHRNQPHNSTVERHLHVLLNAQEQHMQVYKRYMQTDSTFPPAYMSYVGVSKHHGP